MVGSELEFYLLRETYEEAHAKHYRDLTPSVPYILDYHILASTYDEPLLRQIRNGMQGAGIRVETSKGEAWPGQQEINFRYSDALTMADNHVVYKNGAKEIAHLNGCSITFMAKPDHTWIGSSCHIHSSLWRDGESAFAGESERVRAVPRGADRVRARARALLRAEHQLVQAVRGRLVGADDTRLGSRQPHVWVPDRRARVRRCAWSRGSRAATSIRISRSRRRSQRASTGSSTSSSSPPALEGNAYESAAERFPSTLREAIAALENGSMARAALGDDVVEHYLNYARTEQAALRQGRHVLGAGAAVRAWVSRSSGSRRISRRAAWGAWELEAALVPASYVRAVVRAGGVPLLVPPGAATRRRSMRSTGLIFSGGSDLDPELYGEEAHPETDGVVRERDDFELGLMHAALARDLPLLAICRGSQVLNVALGGDLEQHVPDRVGARTSQADAGRVRRPRCRGARGTSSRRSSATARREVASSPGLRRARRRACAKPPAHRTARWRRWRIPTRRFTLGVLWHPEEGEDLALFEALVAEAAEYRTRRAQ